MLIGRAHKCPLGDLAGLPTSTCWAPGPTPRSRATAPASTSPSCRGWTNDWIRYANPIKLKEYLALGLPVVTTRFAEADRYRDLIAIADSPDDFVAAIAATLAGQGTSTALKRRASVTDASWDSRADTLVRHAAHLGATDQPSPSELPEGPGSGIQSDLAVTA